MYPPTISKTRSANDLFNGAYAMFLFFYSFFSDILSKSICCGYSFELHRQIDAIQMGTHNICLYKEVDKKYTGCNLKTTELLDCALIGVCAVIRSNTVYSLRNKKELEPCIEYCCVFWGVHFVFLL